MSVPPATDLPAGAARLVFTDEQLTLLARMAGEQTFPGARPPELDTAGWAAVAEGLAARGVIGGEQAAGEVRLTDAVLGVVLGAERMLAVTVAPGTGDGGTRHEILWIKGPVRVRQTVTEAGFHLFSTCEPGELIDATLELPGGRDCDAPPRALTTAERDELLAAPARITSVEVSTRIGDDRVEGEALTLVESAAGELWLLDEADGSPVLTPLAPDEARARIDALLASIA